MKTQKRFSALILATIMLFTALPISAIAYMSNETTETAAYVNEFQYTVTDGKARIGRYTGEGGVVTLPSIIDGYPVASMDVATFYCCDLLTCVIIPYGISNIAVGAFYGCSSLTSIVIPNSITIVDTRAFAACSSLTNVYYGGTQEQWNSIVFEDDNENLTNATINYNYIPADYTSVEEAVAKVPAELTKYTDVTAKAVTDAVNIVVYDLPEELQETVDAYAVAIEDAVAKLEYKPADYTAVETALAKVPADLSKYTVESAQLVTDAVNAVVYGLTADKQAIVDGYAKAIEEAFIKLELKFVPADYTAVEEALKKVPTDLSIYTTASAIEVRMAVAAIEYNLSVDQQNKVDNYARVLNKAVAELVKITVNIGKVIAATDDMDRFGNKTASITVLKPDGTEEVLTIDTTKNTSVGDDEECVWEGTANNWVDTTEYYFDYTYGSGYTIVGEYIHYEIDENTNQVVRVVAVDEVDSFTPYNSTRNWSVEEYEVGDKFCYNKEFGFYISQDYAGEKVAVVCNPVADDFAGIYCEEVENELQTAYYTASNIPTFANSGKFTFIVADDEYVAMIVHEFPDVKKQVLGIVTNWRIVQGEEEKNGKPTYRYAVTMLVDGEYRTYNTEDLLALEISNINTDDLQTDYFALLRLEYGKIVIENNKLGVDYLKIPDLNYAIATKTLDNSIAATEVLLWTNPVPAGWTTDENGVPVYNANAIEGKITSGSSVILYTCDETEIISFSNKLENFSCDDEAFFQKTSISEITADGTIRVSDADKGIYYIFAYTVFNGEAKDPDNEGKLKNVFVFPRSYLDSSVPADYSAVEKALAKVPADLTIYTDVTARVVTDAVNAVVYGLTIDKQETVDGYAQTIEDAVSNLELFGKIKLTDDLVNYRLRCTTKVVDGNLVLTANPSGTSSMKVRLGNLPEGATVAMVGTNANASMSSGIITVTNPGMKNVNVPMTITSANGVKTEFVLVSDFNNAIRYATYARLSQTGNNITVTSGAATAYVLFDTTEIDGGYVEVENVSRNLLGRYVISGSAVRFYNPVYDNGTVTVNVKNANGETVETYNVTVKFADATEYTAVLDTSLRCTYEVDGDNITVTANAGVSNVYLNFGRYYSESLSASVNNDVIKKMGARSWRIMACDEPVEFDLYFDATTYDAEKVTRHVTVNF